VTAILVVEDDKGVRESLSRALRYEGYEVEAAPDGIEAMQVLDKVAPDVIVLDVMMPVMDGLEVCRRIRARGNTTPILMLTARHEVTDRVAGLDAGADDYVVKPFALDELFARIRALLRRHDDADGTATQLEAHGLRMDVATRQVWRGERPVDLTKTEFDLLELLLSNAGVVLSRGQIYEDIWGFDFESSSNSLDVYIGYLRRKTEEGEEPRLIQTVRGVGYVLRPA
jgi:two-component system response regulator MprA